MKTLKLLLVFLFFVQISFAQVLDLELELVANGFNSPLEIQHAGDDRLFVVERGGQIKILDPSTGIINPTPFLNISSIISTNANERGLLGLAFHPDYSSNGFFYVNYTNTNGNTQISRFTVSGNPNIANNTSELQMLSFTQPFNNHNGGHIAFGPDGMLYIASGDGGSGNDPENNGQNANNLLGALLRLDVDLPAPYIPADNPFVGISGSDEIWAYGLRNPWKFSFDNETGDLWIADVGQSAREEINKEPSTAAGLNYGWRCYEGNLFTNINQGAGCPPIEELTFPIAEYNHSSNRCSITGGYVYRGSEYPAMQGLYFFADLCSNQIGTVNASGNLVFHGIFGVATITSFGVDIDNKLYLTSFGNGGAVFKIKENTPLSINESQLENSFALFPNPASESVTLDFPQRNMEEVAIYDLKGSLLTTENTSNKNNTSIAVSHFSRGMYIVVLTTKTGKKIFKKLIVTN